MVKKLSLMCAVALAVSSCNVRFESSSGSTSPFRPQSAATEDGLRDAVYELFGLFRTDLPAAYKYLSYRCRKLISGDRYLELSKLVNEESMKQVGYSVATITVTDIDIRNFDGTGDIDPRAEVALTAKTPNGDVLVGVTYRPWVHQDGGWRTDDCDDLFTLAQEVYR